ncbi:MAG: ATP-binding protein [Pseudomonadota bacterium]
MAIVRRFAELHGGRATIDTAPGEGARVQVILPLADPATYEEAAQ